MPGPRPSDVPRIRTTLAVYRVSAIVTGIFLLLLCLLMVFRFGFHQDVELGGPFGFLALQQKELIVGVNLSTAILIAHGWLYVLYLGLDFILWRLLRFSFGRFLFIALGGVIPLLSFFFEFRVPKWVHAQLDAVDAPKSEVVA
jgi:integral membrane protein